MFMFKVGKLAQILGVHRNTIRNWIKTKKLKAIPATAKQYAISKQNFITFCWGEKVSGEISNSIQEHLSVPEDLPVITKAKGNLGILGNRFKPEKKLGSVMVVGGGIAGIQATLDLADAGYYVYMIEKTAGIGGAMAQLDKTFPTHDCAM